MSERFSASGHCSGPACGVGGTGSCHPARGQQGPDLAPLRDEPFSAGGRDRKCEGAASGYQEKQE